MLHSFSPWSKDHDRILRADKSQLFIFVISIVIVSLFGNYINSLEGIFRQLLVGLGGVYTITIIGYVFTTLDQLSQDIRSKDSEIERLKKELHSNR